MERRSPRHLLKVLSGPHEGAEVMLGDGESVLGSSYECDLVLADALIAPRHLKFQVEGEKIGLHSLAEGATLNGKPLPNKQANVEHFQFISIGTTHFAIGPAKGAWPSISLEELHRELARGRAPANGAAVVSPGLEKALAGGGESGGGAALDKPASEAPDVPKAVEAPEGAAKTGEGSLLRVAVLIALGCFALGLLIAFAGRSHFAKQPLPAVADPARDVPALLASLGLKERVKLESEKGIWTISGHVPDEAARHRLQLGAAKISPAIRVRVWSDEELAADAREILARLGHKLKVSLDGPGRLKVAGYVKARADWERAAGFIKGDVAGLANLDAAGIVAGDELMGPIRTILIQNGLDGVVKATPEAAGIAVAGVLPEKLRESWNTAQKAIVEKLGSAEWLQNGVQVRPMPGAAAGRQPLDYRIDSIIVGDGVSWISVRNGQKFFPGAVLPNGFVVTEIAGNGVTLKRGGERVTLKIGDNLWVRDK